MTKIRTAGLGAAFIATLLASSSAFAEGTAEQRAACMGDAFRYCSSEIPNVAKITSCMRANFFKLTPACRTVYLEG